MKINEKSLSKYAGSGAPPDREGHLHKRGDFNRGYQKRWFILKGNMLFYYDKKLDKDPIGVIVLEGCTVELSDHEDGFTFMINFPGSNTRIYVLSADTQEEMEAWMKALSGASYDYMKLCVSELKQQLQDLESNTEQNLLQSVLIDRNTYVNSGHIRDTSSNVFRNASFAGSVSTSSSSHSVSSRRRNPFDTEDSLDHESYHDRETLVEKQTRSFLEMHKELRDQIIEITKEWLKTNPLSKATLLTTTESIA